MRKRQTIQYQLVYDAVKMLGTHSTALEIHKKIRETYAGISVATVYSSLKSLVADGEIKVLTFLGSADRYEINTKEHYHIKCQLCGDFCDLLIDRPSSVDEQVAEISGYIVKRHDMIFQGICPTCQKESVKRVENEHASNECDKN